ncbi:MAG: DUF3576 domain-containing protein [Alphaproteobacteria bacterium]|nr:DUF3576 domain-containing protein [Alphaproteobacteria bacterium]
MMRLFFSILFLTGLALVSGCSGISSGPSVLNEDPAERTRRQDGSVFGQSIVLGGESQPSSATSGLAVNGYLWRASLDTISFLPLAQADAFGGVIVTEWSSLPSAPNERYKLTVYILNRELRADGVRVSVFRQERSSTGEWVDAAVSDGVPARIENAILLRARQLRIDSQASLK